MANEPGDQKKIADAIERQRKAAEAEAIERQRKLSDALLNGPKDDLDLAPKTKESKAFVEAVQGLEKAQNLKNPVLIRSWQGKLDVAIREVMQATTEPMAALHPKPIPALSTSTVTDMAAQAAQQEVFKAIQLGKAVENMGLTGDEYRIAKNAADAAMELALDKQQALTTRTPPTGVHIADIPSVQKSVGTGPILPGLDAQLGAPTNEAATRAEASVRAATSHIPDIDRTAAAPKAPKVIIPHFPEVPAAAAAPTPAYPPLDLHSSLNADAHAREAGRIRHALRNIPDLPPAAAAPAPQAAQSFVGPSPAEMRSIQAATDGIVPAKAAPATATPAAVDIDLSVKPATPASPPAPAPLPVLNEVATQDPHSTVKPTVPHARVNSNSLPPLSGTAAPAAPHTPLHIDTSHLREGPTADAVRDAVHGRNQPPVKTTKAARPAATGMGIDAARHATQDAARGVNQPAPISEARLAMPENTIMRAAGPHLDIATQEMKGKLPQVQDVFNKEPAIDFRALADKAGKAAMAARESAGQAIHAAQESAGKLTQSVSDGAGKAAKAVGEGAGQTAKAMGDGLKKIPGLMPEIARNSMAPLAVATTTYEIGKARNQLEAGDKKGAAETIGSTAGALAAGLVAARGMAVSAGQNIQAAGMSSGIPQLGAGSKLVGVTLIAVAGGLSGKSFMGALVGENQQQPAPLKPLTREQELASIPKPYGWEEAQKPSLLSKPLKPSPITNIPIPGVDDAHIDTPVMVAKREPKIPAPGAPLPPQSETVESVAPIPKSAPAAKAAAATPATQAEAPKAEVKAAVPAAKKLPEGKVLHVVEEGETMTAIADSAKFRALRKAAAEALGVKPSDKRYDRDKLTLVAIALAEKSGLYEIDRIHANDKILDTSPEAVKAIAEKLKGINVIDAKGHINPGFQPRDVSKLLNQTPSK